MCLSISESDMWYKWMNMMSRNLITSQGNLIPRLYRCITKCVKKSKEEPVLVLVREPYLSEANCTGSISANARLYQLHWVNRRWEVLLLCIICYYKFNLLTTDDECARHATFAACYQLAQSVLKIGFEQQKR